MKNISYKKSIRRKSIASIVLAFLLTLTFNSSPLMLFAENLRTKNASAYKSSETQTYYTSKSSELETKFGDAIFPSSLGEYFIDSTKNFNTLSNYNTQFEKLFKEKANAFFASFDGIADYHTNFTAFLTFYACDDLYAYYDTHKQEIEALYSITSFKRFVEHFATNETTFGEGDNEVTLPKIADEDGVYQTLSKFYNIFANVTLSESEAADDNLEGVETRNDFYKKSQQYARIKNHIEGIILQTMPIDTYEKESKDDYIAALIANGAPTSLRYNYKTNSYTSTTIPDEQYWQYENGDDKHISIYYFGLISEIETLPIIYDDSTSTPLTTTYNTASAAAENTTLANFKNSITVMTVAERRDIDQDLFFQYRLINDGEIGYIDPDHPTYYKFKNLPSNTFAHVTATQGYDIYVLNNNPTTEDLDTYSALYYNTITETELNENKAYYVNIPYQADGEELYLKTAFNKTLYTQPVTFETYRDYFVNAGKSLLYLKLKSTEVYKVFVDETQYDAFAAYAAANSKRFQIVSVNFSDPAVNMKDYEAIGSTASDYYNGDYNLYFEKVKEYYTTEEIVLGDYETTTKVSVSYEVQDIPTTEYEMESTARKIYVVSENASEEINAITYTGVTQETIDASTNVFIAVPNYVYEEKGVDAETYKLYYKHTVEAAKKLFLVVDDTEYETEKDNNVYKTLNYNVISETELRDNYSNYAAVKSDDANYNKDFNLYYKYLRTRIETQIYVLDDAPATKYDETIYKSVGSGELTDYVLIDKTTNAAIYETAVAALSEVLTEEQQENIKLYYKLSNVFVQNTLKGGNAIYVLDTSITTDDKTTYTRNFFTPITESELETNSNLYVLIDENDPNHSALTDETIKLYYKYPNATNVKTIYNFKDIDTTASDFHKEAYIEIENSDENYVAGEKLYYKKNVSTNSVPLADPTNTTYYHKTSSVVTLSANSYYALTFYVFTTGNAKASVKMKDTEGVLTDIDLNNITTNSTWQQYYAFIATDTLKSSRVDLYLYLGDAEHGIKGSGSDDTITGSVYFDEIKILKLCLTDYAKLAVDDKPVYSTLFKIGEVEQDDQYADAFNNRVFVANTDARFLSNTYDYRVYADNAIDVYDTNTWNNMFDFDNANLQTNLLGKETDDEADKIANQLDTIDANTTGLDMYDASFTSLWRYYLNRTISENGQEYTLNQYRQAYNDGKLEVSITNQIEQTKEDDKDDEETDENTNTDENEEVEENPDVAYIASPFKNNNFVLKLKNTNKNIPLGITSNSFTVEQFAHYKITLWIYSPDKEGKATITINSVVPDTKDLVHGKLLSSSVSSTYANVANSSATNSEYGWIPISIYIEGNNIRDLNCYLVLQAEKDSTVYFDNIHIERITSSEYSSGSSSSGNQSCALSLCQSSSEFASYVSTGITNGTFDLVTNDSQEAIDWETPLTAQSWTTQKNNSTRVIAGVVSTRHDDFFDKYSVTAPTEAFDDFSNIYAIYAPATVKDFDNNDTPFTHNYSIYSAQISLSSNTLYKLSYKFCKTASFTGNMIANIYTSSVASSNIISSFDIPSGSVGDNWQTFTFYISTGTNSQTIYLEIGVKDATGLSYFKYAENKTVSGKTLETLIANANSTASNTSTTDLANSVINVKFIDLSLTNFSQHSVTSSDDNVYDQNVFTENAVVSSKNTVGSSNIAVASYYSTTQTTTYSVTIDDVTYYIGEVYTAEIDETTYFVHKTYNQAANKFEYKLYSDTELKTEITKIGEDDVTIETSPAVVVKVGTTDNATTTTYRLFKFADLRDEVTTISDKSVSVPSLDKVVVGEGTKAKDYESTSENHKTYAYHFNTNTNKEYQLNNVFIPASELNNAQSQNVLILSNSYSTDYIELEQKTTSSIGTSKFMVLRIYVKTSDFAENVGLNIEAKTIDVKWTNINTTSSEDKDEFGFVCYEALIRTNSSDSVPGFGVSFSLGTKDHTTAGYAIISKISLDALANEAEFTHYESLVDDSKDNITKAIYLDTDSETTNSDTEDEEKPDDKNTMSWATFFYIFSSILLVVTIVVAIVAVILKKHPLKFAQKYENEHSRDIDTIKTKKSTQKQSSANQNAEKTNKKSPKDNGGII